MEELLRRDTRGGEGSPVESPGIRHIDMGVVLVDEWTGAEEIWHSRMSRNMDGAKDLVSSTSPHDQLVFSPVEILEKLTGKCYTKINVLSRLFTLRTTVPTIYRCPTT